MSLRYAVEDSKNGCAYSLYNIITPKVGLSYIENMNFSKDRAAGLHAQFRSWWSASWNEYGGDGKCIFLPWKNHGEYRQADCISSILDASGNEIYEGTGE